MAEKQKEQLQEPETQGNGRMACTDLCGWGCMYDGRLAQQTRQSAFMVKLL